MKVIRAMSMTCQPKALCLEEGCRFNRLPSDSSRHAARDHVRITGHEVRVIVETIDLYRPDNWPADPYAEYEETHDA